MRTVLEIAANSFASCMAAVDGGADRIELFENLPEGGCTPSYGMLQLVRQKIDIPVCVMIRPRGGDFLYTDDEFEVMQHDVELCRQLGFPGIVFGILDKHGDVDEQRCKLLLDAAGDMKATYHRALDRARDIDKSVATLANMGFERVLTSGGEPDVDKGRDVIKGLQAKYGNDIIIMPGCGVSAANARTIKDYCNTKEIHATAKEVVASAMEYHKPHFKDSIQQSGLDNIRAIRQALDSTV